jgi:hypothetical protein
MVMMVHRSAGGGGARRAVDGRSLHLLLLVAILPSLTFFGHWGLQFDIPATRWYVVLMPAPPHEDHATSGEEAHHEQHCHANAASCTDVPFTGASPFALLRTSVAYLGAFALLIALAVVTWKPGGSVTIGPELQPPRQLRTA